MLRRWAGEEERGGKRGVGVGGEDGSDEETEEKVSRAEELRRERLGAVVKRNLTGILLEVTDALFGASGFAVQGSSVRHLHAAGSNRTSHHIAGADRQFLDG